ncbi:uncharacterized protein LOC107479069 [Arachis duranensis]|uniref:Uncharacterized protein LOC107479069 n=1 Tax=Arachis duranensis TaxID=130453 RepID=A0A6P4CPU1_ARADU|nr:uncharacterized protein LOC107479069 [Arachis duranensis]
MIKRCPPDMFSDWIRLQIFYDGLLEMARMSLDNSVGNSLHMKKIPEEANKLIEMVVNNQYQYTYERNLVKKGVMEMDTLDAILAQNKAMYQQISMITRHLSRMQVSAVNTQDAFYDMRMEESPKFWVEEATPKVSAKFQQQLSRRTFQEHSEFHVGDQSFNSELEKVQVGQLSKQIPERSPNTLFDDTLVNSKEECKAITVAGESVLEEVQIAEGSEEIEALEKAEGIDIMPLFVMKKLQIQEAQPTRIELQMPDKSLKQEHGIVENVLVKVGELFLPVDFVILDMGEDENDSIILGRPFLASRRAIIDVEKGN